MTPVSPVFRAEAKKVSKPIKEWEHPFHKIE